VLGCAWPWSAAAVAAAGATTGLAGSVGAGARAKPVAGDEGRRRSENAGPAGPHRPQTRDELDAKRAEHHAEVAEGDALDAVDFAWWAVEQAELAVLDAADARTWPTKGGSDRAALRSSGIVSSRDSSYCQPRGRGPCRPGRTVSGRGHRGRQPGHLGSTSVQPLDAPIPDTTATASVPTNGCQVEIVWNASMNEAPRWPVRGAGRAP
jgi:hypothetical protein